MRIQLNDSSKQTPAMKAGLYFTKKPNVLFNKNPKIKYITDEFVKVSKEGSRYIEDLEISQSAKDKFSQIPFIKELSGKFDTFVYFQEMPKSAKNNQFEHVSCAQISWLDKSKESAEKRKFVGKSPVSQSLATEKLFSNIENKSFV